MMARIFAAAVIGVACFAAPACAQEDWREERHEHMERLHRACEAGDERACWRLREMRHEQREREEQRERREWREHDHDGDNRQEWRQDRF
jgi:hypothetical protein